MRLEETVVSSRVRLARNIEDYFFPVRMSEEQKESLLVVIEGLCQEESFCQKAGQLLFQRLESIPNQDKSLLLEQHLISPKLFALPKGTGVITGLAGRISVMINEEDHLRIQGFSPGFDLEDAYIIAQNVDQAFEGSLPLMFDEEKGYLTSCPTNLGTALRASVMLFLPVLSASERLSEEIKKLAREGYALRGFYGEGTKGQGSVFQLSNQVTLGMTEEEILLELEIKARALVEKEWEAMEAWSEEDRFRVENEARKSYGLLLHASALSLEEGIKIVKDLRLARRLDLEFPLVEGITGYNRLIYEMQPAHLYEQQTIGKIYREKKRAELIRKTLLSEA